jgi:polyhydroxyalkanoate synthesis regulator phasin
VDGYIKKSEAVDVIVKYPYNIAGKTATAIKMIENLPSADVVPKSEVEEAEAEIERLKHILDCYALQYGTVMDKYIVIERARAEVASEIFAEIEYLIWQYDTCPANELTEKIAELKKKYTEETK